MDINKFLELDSSLYNEQSFEKSKKLFKTWVSSIEVEAFSYCNRVCWFCPNSFIDRRSKQSYLDWDVFTNLLNSLSDIKYDGLISFSRYNEPFSDDMIYKYISEVRHKLPKARIHANSNGDYFSLSNLLLARDSGLNSMVVQIYLPKNKNNKELAYIYKNEFDKKLRGTLECQLVRDQEDWLEWEYIVDGFRLGLRWRDFKNNGINRADLIVSESPIRISPCMQPTTSIYIDYNGSLMPCCNLRSDYEGHKTSVLGTLSSTNSVFDIYGSSNSASWRRNLSNFSQKKGVCSHCQFDSCDFEQVGKALVNKNKELRDLKYTLRKENK